MLVDDEPALVRLVRQLVAALPLVALPFMPLVGRNGADLLLSALHLTTALQ
jgi:hypothetical protein